MLACFVLCVFLYLLSMIGIYQQTIYSCTNFWLFCFVFVFDLSNNQALNLFFNAMIVCSLLRLGFGVFVIMFIPQPQHKLLITYGIPQTLFAVWACTEQLIYLGPKHLVLMQDQLHHHPKDERLRNKHEPLPYSDLELLASCSLLLLEKA